MARPATAADLLDATRGLMDRWLERLRDSERFEDERLDALAEALADIVDDMEARIERAAAAEEIELDIGARTLRKLRGGKLMVAVREQLTFIEDEHLADVPIESLENLPAPDDILRDLRRTVAAMKKTDELDDDAIGRLTKLLHREQ